MVRTAPHTWDAATLWAEPRVPDPPRRVWRDWALVAVLVPTAVLEGALRPEVAWRPVSVLFAVALIPTLLWRRTHPLGAVAVAFGAVALFNIAAIVGDVGPVGLNTTAYVLLLPYALFRWGSGREVVLGLGITVLAATLGLASDWTNLAEAVLGMLFLLFPAVLGGFVRSWTTARTRELDQVKLREREQLARELHDTVAHHVSAIAVRAQAGRVVAAERPAAAVDALEVIEAEASRALSEMRLVVGSLRHADEPELAPARGLADLVALAPTAGDAAVELELSGDLDDLPPAVGAAVYRLAQESVTNAARHARHATRITVRVSGGHDAVRLTVVDDGDPVASGDVHPSGYGLIGMAERAALVGGTLEAGPRPGGGWAVDAVLPRTGTAR